MSAEVAAGIGAGKLAVAAGIGLPLVAAIVMIMSQPKTKREWAVSLLSTIAFSLLGGAVVVDWLHLAAWLALGIPGIMGIGGIIFACGLPGWVLVRAFFKYTEANKDKGILEVVKEVKDAIKDKE